MTNKYFKFSPVIASEAVAELELYSTRLTFGKTNVGGEAISYQEQLRLLRAKALAMTPCLSLRVVGEAIPLLKAIEIASSFVSISSKLTPRNDKKIILNFTFSF